MQRSLYRLLEENETLLARLVDLFILVLIIASVVAYAASTLPGMHRETEFLLEQIQTWAVVVFTVEYLLRLLAAGGKPDGRGSGREALGYAVSFFGLVDALAILPFYLDLTGFIALRSLRLLRLLRLFKIGRYSRALSLFVQVLRTRASQLGVFVFLSLIFVFIAATGVYHFEHEQQPDAFSSIPASLWWALVTLTTVGYGDSYPIPAWGKVFTGLVLLLGLGVIAIPTGIISAGMVGAMEKRKAAAGTELAVGVCPTCGQTLPPVSEDQRPERGR